VKSFNLGHPVGYVRPPFSRVLTDCALALASGNVKRIGTAFSDTPRPPRGPRGGWYKLVVE